MPTLSPAFVKNAKPGKWHDGGGLYLVCKDSGSKSWVFRMQEAGRRREYGLGSLAVLSLAEARAKARDMAKAIRNGGDPVADRAADRAIPTFAEAARRCHADTNSWCERHGKNWLSSLETHAFPGISDVRIDRLAASDIASAIKRCWAEVPATSRRVLQRIGAVIDYSIAHSWRSSDNPLRSVRILLPKRTIKTKHFRALPYADAPALMAKLIEDRASVPRMAMAFQILTAARPNEARFVRWSEIDVDNALWTVPAAKMKAGDEHTVPLSTGALAILAEAKAMATKAETTAKESKADALVFPGRDGGPLAITTPMRALKQVGCDATAHGTSRATFSTWADEETEFKKPVIEAALAHKNPDLIEQAYKRTTFLAHRRRLMQQWSDFLLPPASGSGDNVVPIRQAS